MALETLKDGLLRIAESIGRRKGGFVLAEGPGNNTFVLAAGSFRAVQVNGGFVVTIQISREQLLGIVDCAKEMLGPSTPDDAV